MNDLDAVFDAGIHFVERNDIFGVMVAELHQVPHLAELAFEESGDLAGHEFWSWGVCSSYAKQKSTV